MIIIMVLSRVQIGLGPPDSRQKISTQPFPLLPTRQCLADNLLGAPVATAPDGRLHKLVLRRGEMNFHVSRISPRPAILKFPCSIP